MILSPANQGHDLDRITFGQRVRRVLRPAHQHRVDLYRDAGSRQAQRFQQGADAGCVGDVAGFTVHRYAHGVAS